MNYRHIYHAGNFADVFKHALLAIIVAYLKRKDAAFRYLDTHAGIGLYDLSSEQAARTGEWRDGVGRLMQASFDPPVQALLEPYLSTIHALQGDGAEGLLRYPGSPELVRRLARPQDRLTLVEKHPEDAASLKRLYARDRRVVAVPLDGWLALNAYLPPPERRGLVLIDPPFEEAGEFARMLSGLHKAHAKWPGGLYALWYPIKDIRKSTAFAGEVAASGVRSVLRLQILTQAADDPARLNGCGLIVVNPPFTLLEESRLLLPALSRILAKSADASWSADWLVPE